ncbi:ribose-phosphate pyrophosphokinase [Lachnospiraceae bacterium YSD2013]|nr:ribose-phosphate pyrophosphokinase [Lachnospiraceae bacterium]MBO4824499.1 ribose-phosphate pyrophosphokinase [Lachnospiraceae bacterium]MBR5761471.1 ribose-phosphate pyrophosphokinase [Lachnospiraceae bacterium]MCR4679681.1 ribose-phosphate pyrophosphokinase [Lachnospiraceae bacterium]SCX00768.1 ribose-phosphate pyrophosphokinase [Lachnospiraceae bacterium YSD2013]
MPNLRVLENALPFAPLKVCALDSAAKLGKSVDNYLVDFRKSLKTGLKSDPAFEGYAEPSFMIDAECPRFGSGEGKGIFNESVRGKDLFILVDVCNSSITYNMNGYINHKSPDDHYQDLKRIIQAATGKAKRINVVMPYLYEGRQHKRNGRESLDCAYALEELYSMGVENIITFDAHDPRVQNAAPLSGFDNFSAYYQFLKTMLEGEEDMIIDKDHTVVISPDEGALDRAVYFASVLGVDAGMFYKRRDYSRVVNGKNPIVSHEFLGDNIDGKDVIIVDDIISSGESILDTARQIKEKNAKRIFLLATFGQFTNGMDAFDKAYEQCVFDKVITTNLIYTKPEVKAKSYYLEADVSKFIAQIIDFMNHDLSIGNVITSTEKIHEVLDKYNERQKFELI